MYTYLLEACDDVDAIVFTGDQLHDEKTLQEFEDYVDSWKREIGRFKELEEKNEIPL